MKKFKKWLNVKLNQDGLNAFPAGVRKLADGKVKYKKGKAVSTHHLSEDFWKYVLEKYPQSKTYVTGVDFMQKYSQAPMPVEPCIPSPIRQDLRIGIMLEELKETIDACNAGDYKEFIDGVIDFQFVLSGTASECGMHDIENTTFPIPFVRHKLKFSTHSSEARSYLLRIAVLIEELKTNFKRKNVADVRRKLVEIYSVWFIFVQTFEMNKILWDGFLEVLCSNASKVKTDGTMILNGINCPMDDRYPRGKYLKPVTYFGPDLEPIIQKHG